MITLMMGNRPASLKTDTGTFELLLKLAGFRRVWRGDKEAT